MNDDLMTIDVTRALGIPGWMTRADLEWLAWQARRKACIVEVGACQGRSTRALADHCAGVVYAVDPWHGDGGSWRIFRQHLADHLEAGRVVAVYESSSIALPRLAAQRGRVADMVFLAGLPGCESCRKDVALAVPLLRPGGLLAGRRCDRWPHEARAGERCVTGSPPASDAVWWMCV